MKISLISWHRINSYWGLFRSSHGWRTETQTASQKGQRPGHSKSQVFAAGRWSLSFWRCSVSAFGAVSCRHGNPHIPSTGPLCSALLPSPSLCSNRPSSMLLGCSSVQWKRTGFKGGGPLDLYCWWISFLFSFLFF